MGRNAVDKLLSYASYVRFVWLEDVFLTGLVARQAQVQHVNISDVYSLKRQKLYSRKSSCIFQHNLNEKSFALTWKLILKYNYLGKKKKILSDKYKEVRPGNIRH